MKIPDNIDVTNAEYLSGYTIRVAFTDGKVNDVDFWTWLYRHPHPSHDKFRNVSKFKKFKIDHGDIFWGRNREMCFPMGSLYFNDLEHCYE